MAIPEEEDLGIEPEEAAMVTDIQDPLEDDEEPTVHDLTRALRQRFRDTGVINDVTARLRSQFVRELRRDGLGIPGAQRAVVGPNVKVVTLRQRVLHSLVVDYMAANGLLQALSIFLPESGLGMVDVASTTVSVSEADRARPGKHSSQDTLPDEDPSASSLAELRAGLTGAALSRGDILRGLPIGSDSDMFGRVLMRVDARGTRQHDTSAPAAGGNRILVTTEREPNEKINGVGESASSLLDSLMVELAERSRIVAVDATSQTEEIGRSHKENLDHRLEAVHDAWLRRAAEEREAPARQVSERMLAYQRDCEARAAAQVKAEVSSFRERDLTAVRLEMAANQRREVDEMRRELQSQYDARLERLQEVERERERRHTEHLRDVEAAQFEARQNLLRDMDHLRNREQESKRGAELETRAVRAEELRLRDLATSLESRAEELRRREREGARSREDLLEAAKHEARQVLELKEENVTREREFLRKEMEAVQSERKACQEQLAQHAENARLLQELRSEVLAQEARARVAEAEAERWSEEAAVYRDAYEKRGEVALVGGKASRRLGRAELKEKLEETESTLRAEEKRHADSLREASVRRQALEAEVAALREREQQWEAKLAELNRSLAYAEVQRGQAEQQAEEEACERVALDTQVTELRLLVRRSRDAIEAITLCGNADSAGASRSPPAFSAAVDTVGRTCISAPTSPATGHALSHAADLCRDNHLLRPSPGDNPSTSNARENDYDYGVAIEGVMTAESNIFPKAGGSSMPSRSSPPNDTERRDVRFADVNGIGLRREIAVASEHARGSLRGMEEGVTHESRQRWIPDHESGNLSPRWESGYLRSSSESCPPHSRDLSWKCFRPRRRRMPEKGNGGGGGSSSKDGQARRRSRQGAGIADPGYWSDGQAPAAAGAQEYMESSKGAPSQVSHGRGWRSTKAMVRGADKGSGRSALWGSFDGSVGMIHRGKNYERGNAPRHLIDFGACSSDGGQEMDNSGVVTRRRGQEPRTAREVRRTSARAKRPTDRRRHEPIEGVGGPHGSYTLITSRHGKGRGHFAGAEHGNSGYQRCPEAAGYFLTEEQQAILRESEWERPRSGREQEGLRRKRQGDRARAEEHEINAMRRRLEEEEEKVAAAAFSASRSTPVAAAEICRGSSRGKERAMEVIATEGRTVDVPRVSRHDTPDEGTGAMDIEKRMVPEVETCAQKVSENRGDGAGASVAVCADPTAKPQIEEDIFHSGARAHEGDLEEFPRSGEPRAVAVDSETKNECAPRLERMCAEEAMLAQEKATPAVTSGTLPGQTVARDGEENHTRTLHPQSIVSRSPGEVLSVETGPYLSKHASPEMLVARESKSDAVRIDPASTARNDFTSDGDEEKITPSHGGPSPRREPSMEGLLESTAARERGNDQSTSGTPHDFAAAPFDQRDEGESIAANASHNEGLTGQIKNGVTNTTSRELMVQKDRSKAEECAGLLQDSDCLEPSITESEASQKSVSRGQDEDGRRDALVEEAEEHDEQAEADQVVEDYRERIRQRRQQRQQRSATESAGDVTPTREEAGGAGSIQDTSQPSERGSRASDGDSVSEGVAERSAVSGGDAEVLGSAIDSSVERDGDPRVPGVVHGGGATGATEASDGEGARRNDGTLGSGVGDTGVEADSMRESSLGGSVSAGGSESDWF